MDIHSFEDELDALISRVRASKAIGLSDLIGAIDAYLEGLKMAEQEGEDF